MWNPLATGFDTTVLHNLSGLGLNYEGNLYFYKGLICFLLSNHSKLKDSVPIFELNKDLGLDLEKLGKELVEPFLSLSAPSLLSAPSAPRVSSVLPSSLSSSSSFVAVSSKKTRSGKKSKLVRKLQSNKD